MRVIGRVVLGIVAIFFVSALLWFLAAAISGAVWRFLIAALIALGVAAFGIGYFRQFANLPPEPQPEEVPPELGLVYVCQMCELELSVIRVAKEKAPKHCGEEMVLIRRDQRPTQEPV